MPLWTYKCEKCESGDTIERPIAPAFCLSCGAKLTVTVGVTASTQEEKKPPQEPPEEPEEAEKPEAPPKKKKGCKYGSIPPTKEKCHKCDEDGCTDRAARNKHHWKRRKAVKIVKTLLGKEIVDIITDREVIKDVAKSRAKKLIEAIGVEGAERDEMLADLEGLIDRGHEKIKKKLK
jgi:hypothetical protein